MSSVPPTSPTFPQQGPPPSKGCSKGCLVLGCLGALILPLICCGGIGGVAVYGMNAFKSEVVALLAENPVVKEHVGEIQSSQVDFWKSVSHEGGDVFVLNLVGSKSAAVAEVISVTNEAGDEEIRGGELILPDGTRHPLLPQEVVAEPAEPALEGESDLEVEVEPMGASE